MEKRPWTELHFAGLSDTGLLRSSNQDDYFMDPEGRFFIVADGMGGHAGGQEASRLATQTIASFLQERWHDDCATSDMLKQALERANGAILKDQQQHPERADMGTTVVVVTFREQDPSPWCAHVGDSRLYRLRGHRPRPTHRRPHLDCQSHSRGGCGCLPVSQSSLASCVVSMFGSRRSYPKSMCRPLRSNPVIGCSFALMV